MKVLAFLASLTQAQMTITSYSATGVNVEFTEIEDATSYLAVQSVGGVESSAAAAGTTHSFTAGSANDVFDYIQIRGMNGDELVSQHHMAGVATGGMGAAVIGMQDLGNNGEGANNGTMLEILAKPDRTSDACYSEMTLAFACPLMADPVVFGQADSDDGSVQASASSYDSSTNTLTLGFGSGFSAAGMKVMANIDHSDCMTDLGFDAETSSASDFNSAISLITAAAGTGTALIAPVPAFELVLVEPADSRVENYPDENEDALPAPHAGKSGMGQAVEGVDNGPVVMYPLNATMVLLTMEIPESADRPTCTPTINIAMGSGCSFNEVKLFGFEATEMTEATLETKLQNANVAEAAMMIVYNKAAVEGTCFDNDNFKPTVTMAYNKFA